MSVPSATADGTATVPSRRDLPAGTDRYGAARLGSAVGSGDCGGPPAPRTPGKGLLMSPVRAVFLRPSRRWYVRGNRSRRSARADSPRRSVSRGAFSAVYPAGGPTAVAVTDPVPVTDPETLAVPAPYGGGHSKPLSATPSRTRGSCAVSARGSPRRAPMRAPCRSCPYGHAGSPSRAPTAAVTWTACPARGPSRSATTTRWCSRPSARCSTRVRRCTSSTWPPRSRTRSPPSCSARCRPDWPTGPASSSAVPRAPTPSRPR